MVDIVIEIICDASEYRSFLKKMAAAIKLLSPLSNTHPKMRSLGIEPKTPALKVPCSTS
jgi:hypothetical protein